MSHLSEFASAVRKEAFLSTPNPRTLGKRVKDFYSAKDAAPTPRRYSIVATPVSRRVDFAADLQVDIEEDQHVGKINDLLDIDWRVFSVGPLFNLDRDDFDNLARNIKKQIGGSKEVAVTVETVVGLRGNCDDSQAIKVQVNWPGQLKEKRAFLAYFLSIEAAESNLKTEVTQLPVCLINGDLSIQKSVVRAFEMEYDTIIHPIKFSEDDMLWMSAMWANNKIDHEFESAKPKRLKTSDQFNLKYQVPDKLIGSGLDYVNVKLDSKVVSEIWTKIHPEKHSEFLLEERNQFHEEIRSHVTNMTGLKLNAFKLMQFNLPILSASNIGKLQMFDTKSVKSVLRFVTGNCQDLTTAQPRMALGEAINCWDTM